MAKKWGNVTISLADKEFDELTARCDKLKIKPYAVVKNLVLVWLQEQRAKVEEPSKPSAPRLR